MSLIHRRAVTSGTGPPDHGGRPGPGKYTEVRHKRAIDLTDRDVIRLNCKPAYRFENGKVVHTGHDLMAGEWREVLSTYHSIDHLHSEYTPEYLRGVLGEQLYDLARDALDRPAVCMPPATFYVMLRLHLHELSYVVTEDTFVVLPRFALVEVQSRPSWGEAPTTFQPAYV